MSARSNLTLSVAVGLLIGLLYLGCFSSPVSAQAQPTVNTPSVHITKTGVLTLDERVVNIGNLAGDIKRRFPNASTVYLIADKDTPPTAVAQVITALESTKLTIKLSSK